MLRVVLGRVECRRRKKCLIVETLSYYLFMLGNRLDIGLINAHHSDLAIQLSLTDSCTD